MGLKTKDEAELRLAELGYQFIGFVSGFKTEHWSRRKPLIWSSEHTHYIDPIGGADWIATTKVSQ